MTSRSTAPPSDAFLRECEVIDASHPAIQQRGSMLRRKTTHATIDACFRYVRDEILHSCDHRRNPVTCTASQALEHGTGYCYAKSHLLAGLLRTNGVPAGLCYQRLSVDGAGPPFCLHGLNAVWLSSVGWFRLDARGAKPEVDARFEPPVERLAFLPTLPGECDLPGVFARPLPQVVAALTAHERWDHLLANLPDGKWCASSIPLT